MLQFLCPSNELLLESCRLVTQCFAILSNELELFESLVVAVELRLVEISLFGQF